MLDTYSMHVADCVYLINSRANIDCGDRFAKTSLVTCANAGKLASYWPFKNIWKYFTATYMYLPDTVTPRCWILDLAYRY